MKVKISTLLMAITVLFVVHTAVLSVSLHSAHSLLGGAECEDRGVTTSDGSCVCMPGAIGLHCELCELPSYGATCQHGATPDLAQKIAAEAWADMRVAILSPEGPQNPHANKWHTVAMAWSAMPNISRVAIVSVPFTTSPLAADDFNLIVTPAPFVGMPRVLRELRAQHVRAKVVVWLWDGCEAEQLAMLRSCVLSGTVDAVITPSIETARALRESCPVGLALPPGAECPWQKNREKRRRVNITLFEARSDGNTALVIDLERFGLSIVRSPMIRIAPYSHLLELLGETAVVVDDTDGTGGAISPYIVDALSCGTVVLALRGGLHRELRKWFPMLPCPQSTSDLNLLVGRQLSDEDGTHSALLEELAAIFASQYGMRPSIDAVVDLYRTLIARDLS